MTLQEKHYKAVGDATAGLFDEREDYLSAREKVAKDSAEITKAYMKGFAKWCANNHTKENLIETAPLGEGQWYNIFTIDELIETYLKEIEANGNQ